MDSNNSLVLIILCIVTFFIFLVCQCEITTRLYIKEGYSQTMNERGVMLWVKK